MRVIFSRRTVPAFNIRETIVNTPRPQKIIIKNRARITLIKNAHTNITYILYIIARVYVAYCVCSHVCTMYCRSCFDDDFFPRLLSMVSSDFLGGSTLLNSYLCPVYGKNLVIDCIVNTCASMAFGHVLDVGIGKK